MKSKVIDIIGFGMEPERAECKADEIVNHFKEFISWMDNPHCPFSTCFNGVDLERPQVCYEKGNKHYTIDEVYNYFIEHYDTKN
jgi:hypothetical protein